MAPERLGPAAPWRWLQHAVALLRAHPRRLVGATALLLAVALSPSVAEGLFWKLSPELGQVLWALMSLLLFPPTVGGYLRFLDALARGHSPAPAPTSIFAIFGDGFACRRLIIANLLFVSASLLLLSALLMAFGGSELTDYLALLTSLPPGSGNVPAPPGGMVPLGVALLLVGIALASAQGLCSAELALRESAPLAAISQSLRATLRHYGLLLLFFLPVAVMLFLLCMLLALVAVLLGSLLAQVLPGGDVALLMLCGLVLALAMYALLFGFFYFAWRELFDSPAPMPPPQHRIAA